MVHKGGGVAELAFTINTLVETGPLIGQPPKAVIPPHAPGAKHLPPGERAERSSPTTFSPIHTNEYHIITYDSIPSLIPTLR
jgi:hypothetical protein